MGSKSKAIGIAILLFISLSASAQTWGEIFNQKKTQEKYLVEQIAAFQVYIDYARKGYKIASSGIGIVKDLKNGEFGLHRAFVGSLKSVNPAIKNSSKVAEIIALQFAISKGFKRLDNSWLSASEQDYIRAVKAKVMAESSTDLEDLLLVITSGKIEMKDDERIRRLDLIYDNIKDKAAFVQNFTGDVNILISRKKQEADEAIRTKKLYGITQ